MSSPVKTKNGKSDAEMKSVTSSYAKKVTARGNSPVRNKGGLQPSVKYDTGLSKVTALIEDKRNSVNETRESQTVLGGSLIFRDPIEIPLQIR